MTQYNIAAKPIFIHRNFIKWDITTKDELVWNKIKKFKKGILLRKYFNDYSKVNGLYFIDISGDCFLLNFHKEKKHRQRLPLNNTCDIMKPLLKFINGWET